MSGAVIPGPWPRSRRRKGEPPPPPSPAEPPDAVLLDLGGRLYRSVRDGDFQAVGAMLRWIANDAERRPKPLIFEVPLLAEVPGGRSWPP